MRLGEMDIPLERDVFLRSLIRELSGVLEDVVGIKKLRDLSALSRVIFSSAETLVLQISDTGIGIPARLDVFEIFRPTSPTARV